MELKELQKHILTLATLPQTADPVISCYLNWEPGLPKGRLFLAERVRLLRGSLRPLRRWDFGEALNRIDAYLRQGVPEGVAGLALFARAGQRPFFLPLQFHVPLPIGSQSIAPQVSCTWLNLRTLTTAMPSYFAPKPASGCSDCMWGP